MSEDRSLQEDTEINPTPEIDAEILDELEVLAAEPSSLEELADQLALATQQAEANRELALRTQAEMENLRRRTEKEVQDARKFALERFAKDLLIVLDSLELGIQAAAGDSPEVVKLREGSELTLRQFESVLEKYNVTPIAALGEKFNPEFHQAMTVDPTADAEPNTVVRVFQKGYTLNDRLLRPAMVVISQKA